MHQFYIFIQLGSLIFFIPNPNQAIYLFFIGFWIIQLHCGIVIKMMEEITLNKGNRIRIIILKEAPPRAALYDHPKTPPQIISPYEQAMGKAKINRPSVAYLSSILQDQHLQTQKSSLPATEVQAEEDSSYGAVSKLQHFRRSGKKSNRYLSCLLETAEEEAPPHAKTQGIQRLLRRRKILPIDKIHPRRKNITFSLKNRRQLNQDFNQFVSKRTVTAVRGDTVSDQQRQTIAFPVRQPVERRGCSLRGDKKKGRKAMQHLQFLEPNLPLPPSFIRKSTASVTKQPGYAVAFKRICSDIPQLNSFEWSRLDQHPYTLAKK